MCQRDRRKRGNGQDEFTYREGRLGFVRIDEDLALSFSDFVGNFFNTFGNLLLDARRLWRD